MSLKVTEVTAPFNTWLPIVVAILVYAGLAVVILLIHKFIYSRFVSKKSEESASLLVNQDAPDADARPAQSAIPRSGQRLYSIDTFRGICLAIMVFVNCEKLPPSFVFCLFVRVGFFLCVCACIILL